MKSLRSLAWLLPALSVAQPSLRADTATDLFGHLCAPCHGQDGGARTPAGRKLGAKDLSQSPLSDAELTKRIAFGMKNEKGTERMPAFGDRLAPVEIDALVAYVKTFRHP